MIWLKEYLFSCFSTMNGMRELHHDTVTAFVYDLTFSTELNLFFLLWFMLWFLSWSISFPLHYGCVDFWKKILSTDIVHIKESMNNEKRKNFIFYSIFLYDSYDVNFLWYWSNRCRIFKSFLFTIFYGYESNGRNPCWSVENSRFKFGFRWQFQYAGFDMEWFS